MPSPKFRSPLRPGRPPGYRRKPVHLVDEVLAECHWLAWDAMKPDTCLEARGKTIRLRINFSKPPDGNDKTVFIPGRNRAQRSLKREYATKDQA